MKLSKFLSVFLVLFLSICVVSCGKDDGGDDDNGGGLNGKGAPDKLPVGYVLANNNAQNNYPLYFWIKTATSGWHYTSKDTRNNTPLYRPYTYIKTGDKTADFSFQYIRLLMAPLRPEYFISKES